MSGQDPGRENSRPMIEWIFGGASAILIAGVMVFLAFEAAFGDKEPPDLAVTIDRLEKVSSGTLVMVTVTNRGDNAAAEVGVETTLTMSGEVPVRKQIRFDYVAAHAVRRGAFIVEGRIEEANDIEVTIHGFVEP